MLPSTFNGHTKKKKMKNDLLGWFRAEGSDATAQFVLLGNQPAHSKDSEGHRRAVVHVSLVIEFRVEHPLPDDRGFPGCARLDFQPDPDQTEMMQSINFYPAGHGLRMELTLL